MPSFIQAARKNCLPVSTPVHQNDDDGDVWGGPNAPSGGLLSSQIQTPKAPNLQTAYTRGCGALAPIAHKGSRA